MQTSLIILSVLVVIFFILQYIAAAKYKDMPLGADHEKVVTLTENNFQQQIGHQVMLVDFWANWCVPCRMMAPVLNEVASELKGDSRVGKVNVEEYQSLAGKYNVRNIPTLILFKDGKEVNRYVGIKSKDFLLKEIVKLN